MSRIHDEVGYANCTRATILATSVGPALYDGFTTIYMRAFNVIYLNELREIKMLAA